MLRSSLALLVLAVPSVTQDATVPRLATRWTEAARSSPHPEYPRPQLVREEWRNLNGEWELAFAPRTDGRPAAFDRRVVVPFPIESALSGVQRRVGPEERVWYRRTFEVPAEWRSGHVRLHFGAVDWEAVVWVDGTRVGEHRGGYDPFWFDVEGALRGEGPHELVVAVWDPTDAGDQPRGKQVREPHGIWYTPTTGIWQTVWLEAVPVRGIDGLALVPAIDPPGVTVALKGDGLRGLTAVVRSVEGDREWVGRAREAGDEPFWMAMNGAEMWTPEAPHLHELEIAVLDGDEVVDRITSYVGLREISVAPDDDGHVRICLNGEPRFQLGLLDQGFWPDGLYTPPTDEALRYDLEVSKRLGFDLVRKHVKVESARFYRHCDELGLLVWQDVPSGDAYIGPRDEDVRRDAQSARQFELETERIVRALQTFPSVIAWVPFNEGWGQFDTARIARWLERRDPTRLVDAASGWVDRGVGHMHDVHAYPGPAMPPRDGKRALVLGEFGGLGLPLSGHTWADEKNWGYRSFDTREALTDAYVALVDQLRPLIAEGLCAAVYTQTTDVEIEVNGLLTYDREVLKLDGPRVVEAHRKLRLPPPVVRVVVPTSQEEAQTWRYTMTAPGEGWEQPGFDDTAWSRGPGGFGTERTPGAVVGTEWNGTDVWLRREFELEEGIDPGELRLKLHHDEDVEVWIDGRSALRKSGWVSGYVTVPIDVEAREALDAGRHVLAVHCGQTDGGQFVDVGIVRWVER